MNTAHEGPFYDRYEPVRVQANTRGVPIKSKTFSLSTTMEGDEDEEVEGSQAEAEPPQEDENLQEESKPDTKKKENSGGASCCDLGANAVNVIAFVVVCVIIRIMPLIFGPSTGPSDDVCGV